MKLIITGASGFVAKGLIPLLDTKGYDCILVSRTKDSLQASYQNHTCIDYDDFGDVVQSADAVLHLAVMNNTSDATAVDFDAANVGVLKTVIEKSQQGSVRHFIYTSTLHAENPKTEYGRSKAKAEELTRNSQGLDTYILRLAAVYGHGFQGKLSILNKLSSFMQKPLFKCLAALQPTTHIERLAAVIDIVLQGNAKNEGVVISVVEPQSDNFVFKVGKALMDWGFALFVILVLWWLLILAWVAVKLTSSGPGIFAQTRIGRNGQHFTCYKLRTMFQETKQVGTHEITSASVTRVGHILRKTKLDELPQVVNILMGQLSLVGPRPCLPNQVELIAARKTRGVLQVKPGITGLAQIHNIDMSAPERLAKVDATYLAHQGLISDCKIILATAIGAGQGDKVS